MILYLDTSALVKLYLEEAGSDQVHAWAEAAEILAMSRVAWPEALSAFSRRHREGAFESDEFEAILKQLEEDWPAYAQCELNEKLAGQLVLKHRLRGFDAVHLAAAVALLSSSSGVDLVFASFDRLLNAAAEKEGLKLIESNPAIS